MRSNRASENGGADKQCACGIRPLARGGCGALPRAHANLKHRAFLMTTYGGGLRLLETCHLKVSDFEMKSARRIQRLRDNAF